MELSWVGLVILAIPWAAALAALAYWVAAAPIVDESAAGKYSVEIEGDFCVFIIGIYVHPRRVWFNLPAFFRAARAMAAIKAELAADPSLGCLLVRHTDALCGFAPTHLVQVWRNYDQLAAYARARVSKHLGSWLAWNAAAKKAPGGQVQGVGIYHEAYVVRSGQYEAVYRNMPRTGLARAGRLISAAEGRMRSGKGRLGQTDGADHAEVEAAAA